jgi:hypothetical protein
MRGIVSSIGGLVQSGLDWYLMIERTDPSVYFLKGEFPPGYRQDNYYWAPIFDEVNPNDRIVFSKESGMMALISPQSIKIVSFSDIGTPCRGVAEITLDTTDLQAAPIFIDRVLWLFKRDQIIQLSHCICYTINRNEEAFINQVTWPRPANLPDHARIVFTKPSLDSIYYYHISAERSSQLLFGKLNFSGLSKFIESQVDSTEDMSQSGFYLDEWRVVLDNFSEESKIVEENGCLIWSSRNKIYSISMDDLIKNGLTQEEMIHQIDMPSNSTWSNVVAADPETNRLFTIFQVGSTALNPSIHWLCQFDMNEQSSHRQKFFLIYEKGAMTSLLSRDYLLEVGFNNRCTREFHIDGNDIKPGHNPDMRRKIPKVQLPYIPSFEQKIIGDYLFPQNNLEIQITSVESSDHKRFIGAWVDHR